MSAAPLQCECPYCGRPAVHVAAEIGELVEDCVLCESNCRTSWVLIKGRWFEGATNPRGEVAPQ